MTIDFHDHKNKYTYAARLAGREWVTCMQLYAPKRDFTALDLGCGGGIYSKALLDLGAGKVIGMDFSESNLEGDQTGFSLYRKI